MTPEELTDIVAYTYKVFSEYPYAVVVNDNEVDEKVQKVKENWE